MSTVAASSSERMVPPTINGEPVYVRAMGLAMGMMVAAGVLASCATVQPVNDANLPDCKTRVAQVIGDREALLAAARAEIAAGKIAAAKQEAELQELRKAVGELRRDNAASHQVLTMLQRTVDTAQEEVERTRRDRAQAEHTKQERELAELRATMQTLTERMDRLNEEVRTVAASPAVTPEEPSRPKPAIEEGRLPKVRPKSAMLPIAAVEQSLLQPIPSKELRP